MTDYITALVNTYSGSGLSSVQTICTMYVIYAFCLYTKKTLWYVLIVHGITGFLGTFIENCFIAKKVSDPNENWAVLLGMNEINWILHESTTVLFSLLKLELIVFSRFYRKILRGVMLVCFVAFASCRINIGVDRVRDNTTMNFAIAQAHSYAFLVWGISDLILFSLLIANTISQLKSNGSSRIVEVLFKSSLPRFLFLISNTFVIVVLGQYPTLCESLQNLNNLVWMFKGSYPLVLLFDVITTRNMIVNRVEAEIIKSSGITSNFAKSAAR
ncbi:hypothetical protein HDV01_006708 [Terramyces sp. JEL0728]|nr:hypothetical protein HDV01_006708 [Terramyces sp. JEL0728]